MCFGGGAYKGGFSVWDLGRSVYYLNAVRRDLVNFMIVELVPALLVVIQAKRCVYLRKKTVNQHGKQKGEVNEINCILEINNSQ